MFLIKLAFWLCVIVALVPIDVGPGTRTDTKNAAYIPAISSQAAGVARSAVSDAASFCDRNPETCATGTQILDRFGVKAIAVAGYVFDIVSGARKSRDPVITDSPVTQPVAGSHKPPGLKAGSGTLGPDDLDAPWVGPVEDDA